MATAALRASAAVMRVAAAIRVAAAMRAARAVAAAEEAMASAVVPAAAAVAAMMAGRGFSDVEAPSSSTRAPLAHQTNVCSCPVVIESLDPGRPFPAQ